MIKGVTRRIYKFNKTRDTDFTQLKYNALLENPFRFFRGTLHLFYEDIPAKSFMFQSPRTWICGDLHLENFGSFKGVHRLYFDMNDFDEAVLAPCLLDVVRLCTSIFLISYSAPFSKAECRKLVRSFLMSFGQRLVQGEADFLEHNAAKGFLKDFMYKVNTRKRIDLLDKKLKATTREGKIHCDNIKAFKAGKTARKKVKHALAKWVAKNGMDASFFKVKDIVRRTAGTGSLGVERYLVLVSGSEAEGNYLLDIKEATPPTLLYYWKMKQPKWRSEAERVIEVQRRVQAAEPIFFSKIVIEDKTYTIKEMQPEENKVNFEKLISDTENFTALINDMGALVAWNLLRSGGRQGSAIADDLIKFGKKLHKYEGDVLQYAENYASVTVKYWREYKRVHKAPEKYNSLNTK